MAVVAHSTPIADGSGLDGRVAGAVLAAIRRQIGLGQDELAELLGVAVKTVGAWEQGRNPLTRLPFARLRQVTRALLVHGACSELVAAFETALQADDILSGLDQRDPKRHPLGLTVPDRAITEMLTWPLTGAIPRQLKGTSAVLHIPVSQRTEAVASLRALAESAGDGEQGAMLRRQAVFLVASHDAAFQHAEGWASSQIKRQASEADLRRWSPEWAVARSAAVRAASTGNHEPLQRFVDEGLSDAETELANLRYWAYWVGEFGTPWASDADMVRTKSDAWSGELLLPSLLTGVVSAPYRELCAHSLWALARTRRMLVTQPRWASAISSTVDKATSDDSLSARARQRLEQVHYLIGSMA
ncbi:helix-turn-helix transcriptional regulator [Nocardia amamiensis]|uniref:Helix-turn-helix transcriptional regulator n=1 Tax=Nocardia amamiensis TaxID=404578 RepID=A0ABS0D2T4_9NOCA|nr:helix-turn-helix transcriptional regulator [Nocardia amamiensis]MBF6302312.1 helix-turn-helix transcriptional regulator [Nocardia amamiensis]